MFRRKDKGVSAGSTVASLQVGKISLPRHQPLRVPLSFLTSAPVTIRCVHVDERDLLRIDIVSKAGVVVASSPTTTVRIPSDMKPGRYDIHVLRTDAQH